MDHLYKQHKGKYQQLLISYPSKHPDKTTLQIYISISLEIITIIHNYYQLIATANFRLFSFSLK